MDHIEIDVVRPQTTKTILDSIHHELASAAEEVRPVFTLRSKLRANQNLLPPTLQRSPNVLLRHPLSVDVGSVDEVDAVIDRGIDYRL